MGEVPMEEGLEDLVAPMEGDGKEDLAVSMEEDNAIDEQGQDEEELSTCVAAFKFLNDLAEKSVMMGADSRLSHIRVLVDENGCDNEIKIASVGVNNTIVVGGSGNPFVVSMLLHSVMGNDDPRDVRTRLSECIIGCSSSFVVASCTPATGVELYLLTPDGNVEEVDCYVAIGSGGCRASLHIGFSIGNVEWPFIMTADAANLLREAICYAAREKASVGGILRVFHVAANPVDDLFENGAEDVIQTLLENHEHEIPPVEVCRHYYVVPVNY